MNKRIISVQDVADVLDHSVLRPDLTTQELREACRFAKENKCISVCVRPSDVEISVEELRGSNVLVTTVIGFPHGTATTESKVFETKDAIAKGAVEVDMVMNISRFLSGEYDYVENDILQVAKETCKRNATLKVIFENYYLDEKQIIKAAEIAKRAGADFIKSSTGYAGGGAVLSDMKIMVEHADGMKVKAAGKIRNLDDCLKLMAIGVVRCGTRASKSILDEAVKRAESNELYLEG
jgi:deoxyribose-phosphate aldolase